MTKETKDVPCTERQLEKKVPESVHASYGGERGRSSELPEQIKHDAKNTKQSLEDEMEDTESDDHESGGHT